MTEREFGVERRNVLTVLVGLALELDNELGDSVASVAKAVHSFTHEQDLPEEELVGCLRVGILSKDEALVSRVVQDERLLTDPKRVGMVGCWLPLLQSEEREAVLEAVKELLSQDDTVVMTPLGSLPIPESEWFLKEAKESIRDHIVELAETDEVEADDFLSRLLDAAPSDVGKLTVLWELLAAEDPRGYKNLKENRDLLESIGSQERNSYVLLAIQAAPTEDWQIWASFLDASDKWDVQAKRALEVQVILLQKFFEVGAEERAAARLIVIRTAAMVAGIEEEAAKELARALQGALTLRQWWSSRELSLEQEELHRLAAELGGGSNTISEAIDAVRKRDLGRALDTPAQVTVAGLDGFAAMARSMNAQFRIAGVEKLAKLQTTLGESLRAAASRAHISLWSSLDESQRSEIGSIEPSEVVFALGDLDEKSREMLALWLAAAPGIEACVAVAAALPRGRARQCARIFGKWGVDLSEDERTTFLVNLWKEGNRLSAWIEPFQELGLDELRMVDYLADEIESASRADDREDCVKCLRTLAPQDLRAQHRVGDIVVELLSTGHKVDFQLALRAVPALGQGHRSKGRIEDSLKQATDELGVKLTRPQAASLKSVGIQPPRRSFSQRAWSFFTGE